MPDADLPPVIRALLDPAAYSHPARDIELRQTHISYVFLAGEYVYKIKKPVDFGFLNYSTLGKRRYYCGREVALNRRLCADTYMGVVPIREVDGRFEVNGKRGPIVEYAVHMRRLPEERMMHTLLERGEVTTKMLEAVAEKLEPFHQSAETSPRIARYGDWAIRYNNAENVRQWQPFVGRTITTEQDTVLRAYLEAFHARKADVMQRRVTELRIRRCHSDLRSDAVCFTCDHTEPECICIFDCVEFSRRITLVDVARDVSFLAMDLEYRGHPNLAAAFVKRYEAIADDPDLSDVYPYFAMYNACVRGKVESFLLDIPEIPEAEKRAAAKRAKPYFGLAVEYAKTLPPALLVITCGLSGTGKSTVANEVASAIGSEVIASDIVRKQLLGIDPNQRAAEEYRAGIYAPDVTQRTYEAMFETARASLMDGRSVVLDASFLRREHRKAAMRLARETGAQFACVEVTADESAVRKRLSARASSGTGPSDAGWEIYVQQKRRSQRPSEVPEERLLSVDTTRRENVRQVIEGLQRVSPLSVE